MDTRHTDSTSAGVMAVLDERVEAVRAKDIDRLMSLYSPGIVYFDVIPPHQFIGAAEVRRNFLRWFDEYKGDIGLETRELHTAASEDVAFAHMIHPDSGTRRNGQDITVWVRSTVCLQRIDGRWLITPRAHLIPHQPGKLERRRRHHALEFAFPATPAFRPKIGQRISWTVID